MARISDEAFDKILDTNVKSNHWLCQMVLPGMVERREGVIIVISSIAGLHGSRSYLKKNLAPLCLATKLQAISGSI
jgi:NADP-dependent 3-hydroxy acid dehydrogenase YdfG